MFLLYRIVKDYYPKNVPIFIVRFKMSGGLLSSCGEEAQQLAEENKELFKTAGGTEC